VLRLASVTSGEPGTPPPFAPDSADAVTGGAARRATEQAVDKVGVRELRNQVAALLRRAAAGERIVITVDGEPTAQLGPLDPPPGAFTVDDLIAAGLAEAPARTDRPAPPPAEDVPVDVRPDDVLDELRGSR
jgi:prevent-host-death family protein